MVFTDLDVIERPFFSEAAFRSFRANQGLWKIGYVTLIALLFLVSAHTRFCLPQTPVADTDYGYLLPALTKLWGEPFQNINGVNFLYPGLIYLILRGFGDFRVIAILQHILGLAAGLLFLAAWNRLADFFVKARLHRGLHRGIGLCGVTIYLFSNNPIALESQIRPDGVCMFFQMLTFWLAIQFFYYRAIAKDARRALAYATVTSIDCLLLASLKPSFALSSIFVLAVVAVLTMTLPRMFAAKLAFFGMCVGLIAALGELQNFFSRNDDVTKVFLPETLFAVHAKIIHAQMAADLKEGTVEPSSEEWLRTACNDLEVDIQRAHEVNPEFFPRLGFVPDQLTVLGRWREQMGDVQFLRFLKYWYFHSLVRRPLAFADKIARQMLVFYSSDCPAFSHAKTMPLGSWYYATSFAALSKEPFLALLSKAPGGMAFLEQSDRLRFSHLVIEERRLIRICSLCLARTYLAILFVSVPLAAWFLLRRHGFGNSKWTAFTVILFYSANFGNIFGISVIHVMEVFRYSTVQFIAALFAQLWAVRWLIEIVLTKVERGENAIH